MPKPTTAEGVHFLDQAHAELEARLDSYLHVVPDWAAGKSRAQSSADLMLALSFSDPVDVRALAACAILRLATPPAALPAEETTP